MSYISGNLFASLFQLTPPICYLKFCKINLSTFIKIIIKRVKNNENLIIPLQKQYISTKTTYRTLVLYGIFARFSTYLSTIRRSICAKF
jgi:hypothetical protein